MDNSIKKKAEQLISLTDHYKNDLSQLLSAPDRIRNEITILNMIPYGAIAISYAPIESLNDKVFLFAAIQINSGVFPYLTYNLVNDRMFLEEVSGISREVSEYIKERFGLDFVKNYDNIADENSHDTENEDKEPLDDELEDIDLSQTKDAPVIGKDEEIKVDFPDISNPYIAHSTIGDTTFVLEGVKKWFIEPLDGEKDYLLEYTTPYKIKINNMVIENRAWGNMLVQVFNYVNSISTKPINELLAFRVSWSGITIFTEEKKSNSKELENGLYLNCNHTAVHSCWLLIELLQLYCIDLRNVILLINRPVGRIIEPIYTEVTTQLKQDFSEYIIEEYGVNPLGVIQAIENQINPIQKVKSPSYPDLFYIDDINLYQTIMSNHKRDIENQTKDLNDNRIECMRMLSKYYSSNRFRNNYKKWLEVFK